MKKNSIQDLLNDLVDKLADEHKKDYDVHVTRNSAANAFALPGGNIVVFSELINQADSENELAFVLAHELGHLANKDHLRGLGRGLALYSISALLLGGDSSVSNIILNALVKVEMKFSQAQEQQADLFALDLIQKKYGHTGGSLDFFKKMAQKDKNSRFSYYFKTHPYPKDRIKKLEEAIEQKGYKMDETKKLGPLRYN